MPEEEGVEPDGLIDEPGSHTMARAASLGQRRGFVVLVAAMGVAILSLVVLNVVQRSRLHHLETQVDSNASEMTRLESRIRDAETGSSGDAAALAIYERLRSPEGVQAMVALNQSVETAVCSGSGPVDQEAVVAFSAAALSKLFPVLKGATGLEGLVSESSFDRSNCENPTMSTIEVPATATPTSTAPRESPALSPGDRCTLGSQPDCIDPDGDGSGTYLLEGASCVAAFPDSIGLCTDLDGDGVAGYPDHG